MPQGIALSPDGSRLAVVESGVNPPALRVLDAHGLRHEITIGLAGAFGKPVWLDRTHVLVAGANAAALLDVDVANRRVARIGLGPAAWPDAVALSGDRATVAISDDAGGTVTIGSLPALAGRTTIRVGPHPGDALFSADGKTLYVAMVGARAVDAIDLATHAVTSIHTGLHPNALALSADGSKLYVTESDDDMLGVIDARSGKRVAGIDLGLHDGRLAGYGASPNALAVTDAAVYVSLGAENAVAVVINGTVAARIPTGWYPSGVAAGTDGTLFVADGKGEGTRANPEFDPRKRGSHGYVAATLAGSIRAISMRHLDRAAATHDVLQNAMPTWQAPRDTALRARGPIRHVIYVIKENRSYDQVLGDVPQGNGDPKLVWFGRDVTPNEHAISRRFGLIDNGYANSQVSADGHNWTDDAFANDYLERFWPPSYGGRRAAYDFQSGVAPEVPHNGYLWDAALRAHVSFRDYGEDVDAPAKPGRAGTTDMKGLKGHFDPRYYGWDLAYGDLDRVAEWRREFATYVARGDLPALEIVYLPNDHTAGSRAGSPTPVAYVATNDLAAGQLVDTVSHSKYWSSTAIFMLEDDAQNGPDHVSNQRSTFFVASPYARAGVHHAHYSTVSVVHTIELLLGIAPLSIYDRTALPLYDLFGTKADLRPYDAIAPRVDLRAINSKAAYGSAISAKLDFAHPDLADPAQLNAVLAHNLQATRR
jgi:YVTN family beta-propeller protein